jgi:hypothetical protein
MKTLVLALCAFVVIAGVAPIVLAQDSSNQSPSASAPSASPPAAAPSADAPKASPDKASPPSGKIDVDIKARSDKSDDAAGAASPRTGDAQRTGFFGLSPTAAIIVSVAVLLVVILAIVAMTHSSGTTYIDTDRRV